MYVGSFTTPERGHGEGVTIFRRAGTGRWAQVHVVKDLENPSFLIADRQGRYLYSVHSDGEPIPPSALPTVFEAWRRGEKKGGQGVGLGLYIVRQIVVAHGGTVAVDSHPLDGTTFTVTLPRAAPAAAPNPMC